MPKNSSPNNSANAPHQMCPGKKKTKGTSLLWTNRIIGYFKKFAVQKIDSQVGSPSKAWCQCSNNYNKVGVRLLDYPCRIFAEIIPSCVSWGVCAQEKVLISKLPKTRTALSITYWFPNPLVARRMFPPHSLFERVACKRKSRKKTTSQENSKTCGSPWLGKFCFGHSVFF